MSLLWADGFEEVPAGGSYGSSGGYVSNDCPPSTSTPTSLGQSLIQGPRNGGGLAIRLAFVPQVKVIAGCHVNNQYGIEQPFFQFAWADGLGQVNVLGFLQPNEQAGLTWRNNDSGVYLSDPNIFFTGTWYFIEVKVDYAASTITVRLDGTAVITCPMGTGWGAHVNYLVFGTTAVDGDRCRRYVDDLYLLNGDGAAPFNDFLGEIIIHAGAPVSDAGTNEWNTVGSGLTGHFDAVNDGSDGTKEDGDFLTIDSSGKNELFGIAHVPDTTLGVLGVAIATRIKKDGAGPAYVKSLAKLGSTLVVNPSHEAFTTWMTKLDFLETKPGGGSWTIADVNNLQIGFQSSAS